MPIEPIPAPDEITLDGVEGLIAIRKDAGFSMMDLAETAGWNVTGIALHEKRKRTNIPFQKVLDIAESCGYELVLRRKESE